MRSIVPSRRAVVAGLLAIFAFGAAVGLVAPAPVDAVPAYGTHIDYYATAALCDQVGYRYYDCDGRLGSSWGVTTIHSVSNTYGCTVTEF
ncbi:MAG TPA: hypothetical protein VHM02_08295 [Thermoanaerobaculia bacterium]|nr:hypothetical protein [Thermoanaerobaculia bacterium]